MKKHTCLFFGFQPNGNSCGVFGIVIFCLLLFLGTAFAWGQEQVVSGSIGKIENMVPGDTFALDLFETPATVVIDRTTVNPLGTVSIRGRIDAFPKGYFSLSATDSNSLGFIRIPEKDLEYRVSYDLETESLIAQEMKPAKKDVLPTGIPLSPDRNPGSEYGVDESRQRALHLPVQSYEKIVDGDDIATITVLIAYTPRARIWANTNAGGIENVIAQAMENTQLALYESKTKTTLEMVYAAEVAYTESGSSSRDLRRLQKPDDGYMDEVHIWRDRYRADLVALLTDTSDIGGIAYQLDRASGDPEYAFSLTRVQQTATTYTFAHEIGHNMGMGHHKAQLPETEEQVHGGLFAYSAGWRWVGNDGNFYSTIMAYPEGRYYEDGIGSKNLPYFSNPQVHYDNKPTGDFIDGDNARTLREVRHVIAAYREGSPEIPVILKFSASPAFIEKGQSATIEWVVENSDDVFIETETGRDIGSVAPSGEIEVTPEEDATYTITAVNSYGQDTESLAITVSPPQDNSDRFPVSGDGSGGGCFIDALRP